MKSLLQGAAKLGAMCLVLATGCQQAPTCEGNGFRDLFPQNGIPAGWIVRHWADVAEPPPPQAAWTVREGVLHGGEPRGTWLVSEKTYGDFILEFEFRLGEQGNSGCGLRFPLHGDPAFDGLELQMVDPRYYGEAAGRIPPSELTGSLYRATAPAEQVFRPGQWNKYHITCLGPRIKVILNGRLIVDVDFDRQTRVIQRHDGTDAPPLKDRPRRGHIGFQELSRGGGHIEIRNARIQELD